MSTVRPNPVQLPRTPAEYGHRPLPAWGVSVALHALFVVIAGLWLQRSPQGVGEDTVRTAGIVLRHMTDEQEWFEGEDDLPQESQTAEHEAATQNDDLTALPSEANAAAEEAARSALPTVGPGSEATETIGDAAAMTRGGGGGAPTIPGGTTKVRVFGVEGEGSSFLYLFDRSTSMEGPPLAAAKQELISSLDSLDSTHQFHILFFNHDVRIWDLTGGQNRVAFASDRNKELANRFVRGITASGGTDRLDALLKGLAFQSDVIFFLSDSDNGMSPRELARVSARNGGRTAIHCIEFGQGPPQSRQNFLTELARRNGGQYVYIDTRRFR